MFELLFGGIWTGIVATLTLILFLSGGLELFQEGIGMAIFLILFLCLFWSIGIAFLTKGLKKLFTNIATSKNGVETFGYVVDIIDSNCYVNGNPVYNIKIAFFDNNLYKECIETSGMDYDKYPIGSYVAIKHHKKDINILGPAEECEVPLNIRNFIQERFGDNSSYNELLKEEIKDDNEEIYIDGVKYVKINDSKINSGFKNNNHEDYLQKRRNENERKFDV